MIDIHCHILPGIDDGPRTLNQSLAIACSLAANGYSSVIATPHSADGIYNSQHRAITKKTADLNCALREAKIPLTIYPGAENLLTPDLLFSNFVTLNDSRYLLVELPFNQPVPQYTREIFFQLQAKGLIPILAHPERCAGLLKNPKLIRDFVKSGILMQVNIASFFGNYGLKAKDLALEWVQHNLVHFLATDSHSPLKNNLVQLKQSVGREVWDKLTETNPRSVLNNSVVQPSAPLDIKRKNFFQNVVGSFIV